jgi:hypothetical protein
MAYLVRRLLENTSNAGFLKLSHHDHVDLKKLMVRPTPQGVGVREPQRMKVGDLASPFTNCELADFSRADVRDALRTALAQLPQSQRVELPLLCRDDRRRDPVERVGRAVRGDRHRRSRSEGGLQRGDGRAEHRSDLPDALLELDAHWWQLDLLHGLLVVR